ncbi:hypothetical protein EJ04DRAFT_117378 [Polyplosphaeria fusca]|uniref:Fibroin-3 related protein n=1 Tax=Polyplosphaeria fusca TaxID=682080 RepID=A0A9P4RCR2_9PLEO|nr:hypothetical protein EJ04DRAFT_117378 [Polyplosphaeria fusca]
MWAGWRGRARRNSVLQVARNSAANEEQTEQSRSGEVCAPGEIGGTVGAAPDRRESCATAAQAILACSSQPRSLTLIEAPRPIVISHRGPVHLLLSLVLCTALLSCGGLNHHFTCSSLCHPPSTFVPGRPTTRPSSLCQRTQPPQPGVHEVPPSSAPPSARLVRANMPSLLAARNPLSDAKNTLSSWDNCMAKNYCKWPVIVAIVVGSLIILSIVLCVARCICCGAECACCCFKCCGGCCGGSGRKGGHKRMNSTAAPPPPVYPSYGMPPAPPPAPVNEQYRPHAVPTYRGVEPERPKFATFDASAKPANEDALPAMPSWSDATSYKVEETVLPEKKGDLEMDRLDQTGAAAVGAGRISPGRSPVQRSPTADSYGFPPGYQNDSFVSAQRNSPGPYTDQYGQHRDDYNGNQSLSPVYGARAGYAQNQQHGRRSPGQGYNRQYNAPSPGPRRSPTQPNMYGDEYGNGYGMSNYGPDVGREPSPASYQNDSYAPAPVRKQSPPYSNPSPVASHPPALMAPAAPAYPGQQTYHTEDAAQTSKPTYRAFTPAQDQYGGAQRAPGDQSWKEV